MKSKIVCTLDHLVEQRLDLDRRGIIGTTAIVWRRCAWFGMTAIVAGLLASPASATMYEPGYAVPNDFTIFGTKWGPGVGMGTPGVASVSVMPVGTVMEGGGEGPNADFSILAGGVDELGTVHAALAVWAAVCNFTDLGTVADSGAAFNAAPADPRGVGGPFGDIRLGSADIPTASVLAHAYYPPPNGTSASGDAHFDNTYVWVDDPADTTVDFDFDFFTVALHELGHSLGLGHSASPGSVMEPVYAGARRSLTADDIAGIQTIYGLPAVVPEPTAMLLMAVVGGALLRAKWRRSSPRDFPPARKGLQP